MQELNNNKISFFCGVFTSWSHIKTNNNKHTVILHFAVNRFVGEDKIHYDLPANNFDKKHKDRVALYIELEIEDIPTNVESLSNFNFVDKRFNNLTHKTSEYVLQISYTTKNVNNVYRHIEGKPSVNCFFFSMGADSVVEISSEGHYLWTEEFQNTRKITNINEAVNIISSNIVRVPTHINSRTMAYLI